MDESILRQWEANAEAFAELINGRGTPHHREILNPCVERLLGDVKGKRMLDAGCGEGYLSRYYTKTGAIVTGVDISRELVDISKRLAEEEGLNTTFEVGDICDLRDMEDQTFDIVLCNLVLLNIPCLDAALREFHRVLRDDGTLVFSIVHPAFNFYGPGTWEMGEKNPDTGRRQGLFFRVDHYFDEREYKRYWRTRRGEKFPEPISFFHRTISTYFRALRRAGFVVVNIEEPLPVTDDDFFDRERRIPFFLVFDAVK